MHCIETTFTIGEQASLYKKCIEPRDEPEIELHFLGLLSEDADGTGMLDGKIVFIDPLNLPFHFQCFEYNGKNPAHGRSDGQRKSFF